MWSTEASTARGMSARRKRGKLAVRQRGQRPVAQRHRARLLDAVEEFGAVVQQPLGQAGCPGEQGGKDERGHVVASERTCCELRVVMYAGIPSWPQHIPAW